ncbi:hypothetical protein PVL29_026987 [Vitis rotundifolia]|uniref:Uncharacterized protein n=1 Tax=Vitis rotundifolia TaxID=103349 RepID=A0AA38YHY8_VITRO|nr:hypothetical protein PVL29_026987 [Vitis rotundifolia]
MQCCDHHIQFSLLKSRVFFEPSYSIQRRNHPVDHFPSLFMAKIRFIHACSLLLAVITYHHILCTKARPIKSPSSIDFEPEKETGSQGTEHKDLWCGPSPPEPNPTVKNSVAGKEEILPPMIPNYSVGFGDSAAVHTDGFRPTTPGSSPVPRHSVKANKDDYRPTVLGHCPGVGHSLQKTNAEPNA